MAEFFAEQGSLTINRGAPAIGRVAIAAAAQGFMTAFPNLVVVMDSVGAIGPTVFYRWTLTGTNTGRLGPAAGCVSAATKSGPSALMA